jgi:hypothetical protein
MEIKTVISVVMILVLAGGIVYAFFGPDATYPPDENDVVVPVKKKKRGRGRPKGSKNKPKLKTGV